MVSRTELRGVATTPTPTATTLVDLDYTYNVSTTDTMLRRTTVDNRVGVTTTYGYDALGQLTSAVETGASTNSWSYTHDARGNRLTSESMRTNQPYIDPRALDDTGGPYWRWGYPGFPPYRGR